jgi:undecaprenyl-diphosphatase
MDEFNPFQRLRTNWTLFARRLAAARRRQPPVDWRRVGLIVAGGFALVIFVAILYDARVIAWTRTMPGAVRSFFAWATRFGQSDWLLTPTGVIVVVVALADWRRVSRVHAVAWWEIATTAGLLYVLITVSGLVTDIIKPIVGRFRPDFVEHGAFAFAPFTFGGYPHYSFPSGHATTMAAVAILVAFVPSLITTPIVVAAAIVAISRVMIDAHFPSDVVGGALIGLGVGYVVLGAAARAGIVFAERADGNVRGRFGVLRRLSRRPGGLVGLLPALWIALGGRRPAQPPPLT